MKAYYLFPQSYVRHYSFHSLVQDVSFLLAFLSDWPSMILITGLLQHTSLPRNLTNIALHHPDLRKVIV